MTYLPELLTVASIHLLAVMSPGPDFFLISRNSLVYSRKAGIYSALGLALGISVHIAYSLLGIGLIISKSVVLFSLIKFLGAGYLIYIGYKSLYAQSPAVHAADEEKKEDLPISQAIRVGFLTNILNPKVTLFFLALFTQVINPQTPLPVQLLYGLEMAFMTFAWFAGVATLLSHSIVRSRFAFIQQYAEKFFGAILIVLGIKVAISSSK
ncbi:MAG: LysE family transporter [Candidatus Andersenbacteria bacterium]